MTATVTVTGSVDNDYAEVEEMLARLSGAASDDERRRWRCEIITACLPLADHIAYRFVGRGEPGDDLVQVARLGLVKAVDRYRPGNGRFLGFAVPTIVGDVRRYFRDNTWGIHVPRPLKETHQRVRAVIGPLSQRLGRAPTAGEIAAELGVAVHQVAESIDAAYAYRPASLDARAVGDPNSGSPSPRERGGEDPRYLRVEDALAVADMVRHLTGRERLILKMRFCDCLSQTQIAEHLGISQVQVSRLLAGILQRLRTGFWADPDSGLSGQPAPRAAAPA